MTRRQAIAIVRNEARYSICTCPTGGEPCSKQRFRQAVKVVLATPRRPKAARLAR